MDAPLTFPVPLPVILNKQEDNDKSTPMPVKVTNLPDAEMQEEQLDNSTALLGFFQQFWNKEKKFQNLDKLNLKMAQAWDKIGIGKFAGGVLKGFKSMISGIAGMGMGLIGMLTGLLALAFFDPSGGFLASIIGMFANFLIMFIDIVAGLIPKLIPILVKIIPVLVKAFSKIIEAVGKMIPVIIEALVKGLPLLYEALKKAVPMLVTNIMDAIIKTMQLIKDKIPFLEPILTFIEKTGEGIKKIFDPNDGDVKTRLQIFAKETFSNLMTAMSDQFQNIRSLANEVFGEKKVRSIEAAMILYGVLSVILGGMVTILGVVNFLLGVKKTLLLAESLGLIAANAGLGGMVAALWALVAPILPFVLLVVLLIAAFVLLYVYWDEVVDFLSKAWEWLKEIMIEGWNAVVEWFPEAMNTLGEWISSALDWIVEMFFGFIDLLMIPIDFIFDSVMYLYKQFMKIKDKLKPVFDSILKVFTDIFGKIKSVFEGKLDIGHAISNAVRSAFSNIPGMDSIKNFFNDLLHTIEDSDVWRGLTKIKKFVTGGEASIQEKITETLVKKGLSGATSGVGNVIKNYVESGGAIDKKAYAKEGLSADAVDAIVNAIKESKVDTDKLKSAAGTIDMSKTNDLLTKIAENSQVQKMVQGYNSNPTVGEKSLFGKVKGFFGGNQ